MSLTGPLEEEERRVVAARAILGEWLGGSGGGWQDSGGVWPGIKVIEGAPASEGDPEFGVSRGRLLPNHRILGEREVSAETRRRLQDSLVLVHGGMAQDVGPILEMVAERYLLRSNAEWAARQTACKVLDEILEDLRAGDVRAIGGATQRNFDGPIQTIIPWASNLYTETLIQEVRAEFGDAFWGFWMLGGMSGGGMGFIFDPKRKPEAQRRLGELMREVSERLAGGVAFAMKPVVYDFSINERGTFAELKTGNEAMLPDGYYNIVLPALLRKDQRLLSACERGDLERFSALWHDVPAHGIGRAGFSIGFCRAPTAAESNGDSGVAPQGRMDSIPSSMSESRPSCGPGISVWRRTGLPRRCRLKMWRRRISLTRGARWMRRYRKLGEEALAAGAVAVVTLSGGAGSRWTHGAGVVKALSPFCRLAGTHRTFLEVHLAKSRRTGKRYGCEVPHAITTSYLTHGPIEEFLRRENAYGYTGPLYLSAGQSVGLRLIPTVRDLRFAWEDTPQQMLDAQAQKVRESVRAALVAWAQQAGEAASYTDNLPLQCLHPVGHWYEVPNLFLQRRAPENAGGQPELRTLMVHNVDTVGADLDPGILGRHIASKATMTVEVVTRRIEDRGGGLALVDGRVRLVEGMALPSEEIEFALSYYNSNTFWIDIDALLKVFGLKRRDLRDRDEGGRGDPRHGRAHAHLHHAEGREKALGQGAGRHLSRGAVRKALGRHDGSAADGVRIRDCSAGARAAAQGAGAVGWMAARRLGGSRDAIMRVWQVRTAERPKAAVLSTQCVFDSDATRITAS